MQLPGARGRFAWGVAGLFAVAGGLLMLPGACAAAERDYAFDGSISREVLEHYLARSMTCMDWLTGRLDADELARFVKNTGVKFAGRAIYRWGSEDRLEELCARARPIAERLHAADPELILQGAVFEIVTERVGALPAPAWLFREFGLEPEERNFRYEAMLYPDGHRVNQWSRGASVPDMSQLETRMWFVYAVSLYVDAGVEAIHFGQVEIMDDRDPDHAHWAGMLDRCRSMAAKRARRHLLLCDAHVPGGGIVRGGKLLFDFHSFPLRIEEVADRPLEGVLQQGYLDSLFGRSAGGCAPCGWACESLPYIVEFDNFEPSGHPGENIGAHWCWGYDEICWFAQQTPEYRRAWLRYAWDWIRTTDPNGFLQMPGSRCLATPPPGKRWYYANSPGSACPGGFGDEATIKAIWAGDK